MPRTKACRQVAVKVLSDVFAGDPERLARFEGEARLLASLNHANIAAIYGLEQAEGIRFLLLKMRDRKVTPFLNSEFDEMSPEFSPDGRWVAYVSTESGRNEVYVRQFPGPGSKWQISGEGGTEPLWSRNGRQLFFRRLDQFLVVDVQVGSGFSASRPRLLFKQPGYWDSAPIRCWDISPDGLRFVMVKLGERKPQPVTEMILIQNWSEELKHLHPTEQKK